MAETWLTYRELAQALNRAPESYSCTQATPAGQRRQGWILVDLEAEKAVHTPRGRPDDQPDERRMFEALEQ